MTAGTTTGTSKAVQVRPLETGQAKFTQCTGNFKILGLTNGQPYLARVSAYNSMGFGPAGIAKGIAKPTVVPSSPLLVTLTVVDSQTLRVFFNPPDNNGGDSVTEYMVELDSSQDFDSAAAATEYRGHKFLSEFLGPVMYLEGNAVPVTFTFTGLTMGTRYYARVSAYNNEGYGIPAQSSPASEVPRQAPSAPTSVELHTTSDTELTVSFGLPLTNGGEDVTLYRVDWDVSPSCDSNTSPPHKGSVVLSAALYNYYTITDLTPGRAYYTRVATANSMGFGPVAISSPPRGVPSLQLAGVAESVNVYESGADELTVVWTPPTIPDHRSPCNGTIAKKGLCPGGVADGGAKIMTYIVQRDTSPTFASSNSRVKTIEAFAHQYMYTAVFGGSESYTDYYVRVFATNSQGTGKQSKVLHIKTGDVESGSPVVSQVVVFNADCAPLGKQSFVFERMLHVARTCPVHGNEMRFCGGHLARSQNLRVPAFGKAEKRWIEASKFQTDGL